MISFTASADEPLSFSSKYTECVNRWVSLKYDSEKDEYSMGFIYIDIEAGPTYHIAGNFKID